jgi:hypothetical protein
VTFPTPDSGPIEPSAGVPRDRRPWEPLGYSGPVGYPGPLEYPVARPGHRYLGEGLVALGLAAVVALLGFPLGMLWSALAPHVPAVMTAEGPVYAQPDGEQPVGAEGTYVFLTLGAGLVLAILAWVLLRRFRGLAVLLGLGLGGVGAGVLTWWYGHRIGRHSAPVGAHFDAAVNLRVRQVGLWHHWLPYVRGDVLFLAIAAILMYVLLAGFSPYPALRRPTEAEVRAAQIRAAESVRAVGDGQLGQWYGHRPDVPEQGDLPIQ